MSALDRLESAGDRLLTTRWWRLGDLLVELASWLRTEVW